MTKRRIASDVQEPHIHGSIHELLCDLLPSSVEVMKGNVGYGGGAGHGGVGDGTVN